MTNTPEPWILNIEDGRAEVCVDGERLTDPYIGDENARLIAAAPDLSDMVFDLLALHEAHHNHPLHAKARALLAKAEGRS